VFLIFKMVSHLKILMKFMRRKIMIRNVSLAIIIASLLILPILVFAQEEEVETMETPATLTSGGTGVIRGSVVDTSPNRNPVGGVSVSYVGSGADNRGEVASDATTGEYEITGLKPGQYIISTYKSGYADRTEIPATVVAGNDTVVEIKMRKKDTPITYFQKMGWVGWPLLVCSIMMLTFIIERAFALIRARSRIGTEQFMTRITESLRNDNIMEAVSVCEEAGGPLANVLKAGLLRYSQAMIEEREVTKEEIQEAVQEAGLLEIPQLEKNLPILGTLGMVSPLFGLLGTVWGMIVAFTTIALEGTGDPQQLADGISQALLTTAVGLMIAIPCMVAYGLFDARVNTYVVEIEQVSNEMINSLLMGRPGAEEAQQA
jgi:biopolymer transport protein ExbB